MTFPLTKSTFVVMEEPTPKPPNQQGAPTNMFHQVNSVIPDTPPRTLPLDTPVKDALEILKNNNYSQIPLVAGDEVLGIFSYRSFALNSHLLAEKKANMDLMTVEDFIDTTSLEFSGIYDDLSKIINPLDKNDVVLIGSSEKITGMLTSIDLVKYLYQLSKPFMLLGEIEGSIRTIIRFCIPIEDMQTLIDATLSSKYNPEGKTPKRMPNSIEAMEFGDYSSIICSRDPWHKFEKILGQGELRRTSVITKLEEIRLIRNDVFHFKRALTDSNTVTLSETRDWWKNKVKTYQSRKVGA